MQSKHHCNGVFVASINERIDRLPELEPAEPGRAHVGAQLFYTCGQGGFLRFSAEHDHGAIVVFEAKSKRQFASFAVATYDGRVFDLRSKIALQQGCKVLHAVAAWHFATVGAAVGNRYFGKAGELHRWAWWHALCHGWVGQACSTGEQQQQQRERGDPRAYAIPCAIPRAIPRAIPHAIHQ